MRRCPLRRRDGRRGGDPPASAGCSAARRAAGGRGSARSARSVQRRRTGDPGPARCVSRRVPGVSPRPHRRARDDNGDGLRRTSQRRGAGGPRSVRRPSGVARHPRDRRERQLALQGRCRPDDRRSQPLRLPRGSIRYAARGSREIGLSCASWSMALAVSGPRRRERCPPRPSLRRRPCRPPRRHHRARCRHTSGRKILDFNALAVGTCLHQEPARSGLAEEDRRVWITDCGQPHHGELFHVVVLEGAPGSPFPGEAVVSAQGDSVVTWPPSLPTSVCPSTRPASTSSTSTPWPSNGRRATARVQCILYGGTPDELLTRSMAGSGE